MLRVWSALMWLLMVKHVQSLLFAFKECGGFQNITVNPRAHID